MEEANSQLCSSISDWRLKQQSLRNLRNARQLQNRLVILEMQRQAKIKSIERKLDLHRRMMEVRMDRFKLKQEIQEHQCSVNQAAGSNSRLFKDTRINRDNNIRTKSSMFRQTNHKLFQQVKGQRKINELKIRQQNIRETVIKTEKRNRVRLIEIESKENINKFWKGRLGQLKEQRKQEIQSRLIREQRKMEDIMKLERSEQELLKQIKRTEEMELKLASMMEEERSMVVTAIKTSHIQNI